METHNSCSSAFSDIGFPPDEAANLLFRASLMARLTKITNDRELTQHAAAIHCPVCDRRCELLYLRGSRFACRHCQKIACTSQSGGSIDRLTHKLHKMRARTKNGKPKGMRWAMYRAVWHRAFELEDLAERYFAMRSASLLGLHSDGCFLHEPTTT